MTSRPAHHAHALATFRWIEVRLMELVAAWVPTTPEMEVKLLLGEHLYDFARHADALGKRTRELRAPLHDSRAPAPAYVEVLERLSAAAETGERLAGLYGAVLPRLARRYRSYLEETDPILDAPTVRIVEEVLRDAERMQVQLGELVRELPHVTCAESAWSARLAEDEEAVDALRSDAEASQAAKP